MIPFFYPKLLENTRYKHTPEEGATGRHQNNIFAGYSGCKSSLETHVHKAAIVQALTENHRDLILFLQQHSSKLGSLAVGEKLIELGGEGDTVQYKLYSAANCLEAIARYAPRGREPSWILAHDLHWQELETLGQTLEQGIRVLNGTPEQTLLKNAASAFRTLADKLKLDVGFTSLTDLPPH